jgi:hypothetical protein
MTGVSVKTELSLAERTRKSMAPSLIHQAKQRVGARAAPSSLEQKSKMLSLEQSACEFI